MELPRSPSKRGKAMRKIWVQERLWERENVDKEMRGIESIEGSRTSVNY